MLTILQLRTHTLSPVGNPPSRGVYPTDQICSRTWILICKVVGGTSEGIQLYAQTSMAILCWVTKSHADRVEDTYDLPRIVLHKKAGYSQGFH